MLVHVKGVKGWWETDETMQKWEHLCFWGREGSVVGDSWSFLPDARLNHTQGHSNLQAHLFGYACFTVSLRH